MSDETVMAALEGMTGQGIVLTNRRVIMLKAGSSSGAMFGRKAKAYPLEHISSVEYSCGLTQGRVQLSVAGTVEHQHGWERHNGSLLDQLTRAQQAENVCQFPSNKKQLFQAVAQLIQHTCESRRNAPPARPESTSDIPAQIRKLAELAEQGILTRDEFERKKAELLARM